jgi:hypothetical protein
LFRKAVTKMIHESLSQKFSSSLGNDDEHGFSTFNNTLNLSSSLANNRIYHVNIIVQNQLLYLSFTSLRPPFPLLLVILPLHDKRRNLLLPRRVVVSIDTTTVKAVAYLNRRTIYRDFNSNHPLYASLSFHSLHHFLIDMFSTIKNKEQLDFVSLPAVVIETNPPIVAVRNY